jgi:hypothetical protein
VALIEGNTVIGYAFQQGIAPERKAMPVEEKSTITSPIAVFVCTRNKKIIL